MANTEELSILVKLKDEASAQMGQVTNAIKNHSAQIRQAGIALTAFGAAVTGVLGMAVKAAADEAAGIQRLSQAMDNVGLSYGLAQDSLEAWIAANQASTRFSDGEQRDALSSLVVMTGDMARSQDLLSLAMDISAGTGRDLASVTTTLGYALAGNWGMVNRMIPALSQAKTEEEKWMMLREMFAGQAEAYGSTVAGQFEIVKNGISDLAEIVGGVLLPAVATILNAVRPLIEGLMAWMQAHPQLATAIIATIAVLGVLAAILGPILLMLPALAAGFSMLAGPVGIAIAAFVALSAAAILIAANLDTIVESHKTAFTMVVNFLSGMVEYFVNSIIRMLNAIPNAINAISGALGGSFSFPVIPEVQLPRLASGGIVTRPTLALVGEAGPEAVVPLSRGGTVGGGGSITVQVFNQGSVISERDLVASIRNSLLDLKGQNLNLGLS
ncbi:MAG: hypothetical protein PHQ43_05725 [Dehalococcoidales bacterium]|nr:hypothetical protein [Dehalococcoidales bacterium]